MLLREDGPRWQEYQHGKNSVLTPGSSAASRLGVGHTWEPSSSYYPSRDRAITGATIGKENAPSVRRAQNKRSALSKAGGKVLRQALSSDGDAHAAKVEEARHPRDYYKLQQKLTSEQQIVHDLIDPPDSYRENYPPLPVARVANQQQEASQTHHSQENVFVRDVPVALPERLPQQRFEQRDRRAGHEAGYLGQRAVSKLAAGNDRKIGRSVGEPRENVGGYAQQYQRKMQRDQQPRSSLDRSRLRKMTYDPDSQVMMQSPQVGAIRTRILDVSYQ